MTKHQDPSQTTQQPTLAKWLESAVKVIVSDSPQLDAELLLSYHLGKNRAYLRAFADNLLPTELYPTLKKALQQLASGYPLAYILGEKSFWDMRLKVTPATLVPRADSETLIEACQKLLPADFSGKLLDLGTGSGALAIALSRIFPKADITATDNSTAALAVAQENAQHWQIAPIRFVLADWFLPKDNHLPHVAFPPRGFEVIISNPPYLAADDPHLQALKHEPITALTAADNGLADIKTLVRCAAEKLKENGFLMLEHGYDQAEAVRQCFAQDSHWQQIQTLQDLGGNDRVTLAQYHHVN